MIKDGMLSKEHMGYKIGSFWLWGGGKKQETVLLVWNIEN